MCFLLAWSAFFIACEKKPQPLTGVQVRAITRELVRAVKEASGGRAETGMFPERQPVPPQSRGSDTVASPPADLIFVTLPRMDNGREDGAALKAILDEMDRVAELHHLTRAQRKGAPGILRFDFFFAGQRTQTVELVTQIVGNGSGQARANGLPKLAIIIDDLGYDREAAETLFQIPYPLTVSVLPHLTLSSIIAEEAFRRGYQVLLHMPVESNGGEKAESVELRAGMPSEDAVRMLQGMLGTVPQAIGVNNHQGSLGTADATLMNAIMPALQERGLFFVDSRTTYASVAFASARRAGVPVASRDVFLDDVQDAAAIRHQLDLAVRDAKLHGQAIAIGHPHPATLKVLQDYLPKIESEGVEIMFVSKLVR
jgi:polysaccharide deacetylase 2 family uncharacterized protein YibQ